METNEIILTIVKEKGPILPVQVSKEISDNILITSARLSELLTQKKIKISFLKVGGSPLYYFSGQEIKLQNFVDNLQVVEKKAYDLLSQKKVLKDLDQEPAVRVALRQIKDFAILLQVNFENKIELFWRWYMINNGEAEPIIKSILSKKNPLVEKIVQNQQQTKEIIHDPRKVPPKKISKINGNDLFSKNITYFFDKYKINVKEKSADSKKSEFNFIVGLQTPIGEITYFCKAKNKKRISDLDLSSAAILAQSKNLPLLFLTDGDLTKKAEKMLNLELKNITFRKIQ